jgi:hypothetical protein
VPLEGNHHFLLSGLAPLADRLSRKTDGTSKGDALALADLVKTTMAEAHITKSKREIDALLSKMSK